MKKRITLVATSLSLWFSIGHAQTYCSNDLNGFIQVKVEDGWVTLEGNVEWNYQREAARNCIANLIGVKGVSNNIKVKSTTTDQVEQTAIENALSRSCLVDDRNIQVKVKGNKVTLRGAVESLYQKEEAARLAWNAPGVTEVDNELAIIQE